MEADPVAILLEAEPKLRRLLLHQFRFSEDIAEDVLSGVCERWLHLQTRPTVPEHPHSYLVALTRNAAVDHMRKAVTRHEVLVGSAVWETLEPQAGYERSAEDIVTERAAHEELLAKVQSLPHVQRRVIELVFLQGLSVRETAEHLGISEGAAARNRQRAVRTLRNMYAHASSGSGTVSGAGTS